MSKIKDNLEINPIEVISGWAKEKENPYSLESDDDEKYYAEEKHQTELESFFNRAND